MDHVDDGSETTNQPLSAGSDEVVTESFLSLAKDFRYVKQCRDLLQQALDQMDPNGRAESKIYKASWFLSSFLYIMVVIMPSGRTLGMESCGLVFQRKRKGRLVASLLTTTFGWFALDYVINHRKSNVPSENREELRGYDRVEMHRILRTQMMRRATLQPGEDNTSDSQRTITTSSTTQQNENLMDAQWKRILKGLCSITKSINEAFLNEPEGPHSLNVNTPQFLSNTSLITWMTRLHIAHYCLTGKYPTIFHRLFQLRHTSDGTSPIIFQPKTNKLVAMLIGVQASATLTRLVLNFSAKRMAEYLESRRRRSSSMDIPMLFPFPKKKYQSKSESKATCGICRLNRDNPAASILCGHVFCWDCLMQWVSTNQACPICRKQCNARDIVCLYNY